MDIMGILGVVLGFACLIISILLNGELLSFFDPASIFIVFGGVICATIANYSFKQFMALGKMFKIATSKEKIDYKKSIDTIVYLANIARKDGVLKLEAEANSIDDKFLQKGIMLVVDGSDPELVKNILETELNFIEERHGRAQTMLYSMSAYAPAFGMAGTLIGLINMLKKLDDPSILGTSMAVALVTTFYGVILANLVFTPTAGRLKEKTAHEIMYKEMLIEGILSIQAGENPRITEEKLKAFLSENQQNKMNSEKKGD